MEEWSTRITRVEPDSLLIAGYPLEKLVESRGLLETTHVLICGVLPSSMILQSMQEVFCLALEASAPDVNHVWGDDVSKTLAKSLLMDQSLPFKGEPHIQAAFCIGRMVRYVAHLNNHVIEEGSMASIMESALGGRPGSGKLMEAIAVACVDHGVTPPSAQATLILSSTRASYEVAVAGGISAITDVHGGAGAKAAAFFQSVVSESRKEETEVEDSLRSLIKENLSSKKRIPGLGHRVHKNDPRRDVLWRIADETGVAKEHTRASHAITGVFQQESGKSLPINVDGVIGALVADMGLDIAHAKTLFIIGRTAGLSAHYFEELTRPAMRRMDFSKCVYRGEARRDF